MIDIGVASPSAQGQAMISTATALRSPNPIAGGGPKIDHAANEAGNAWNQVSNAAADAAANAANAVGDAVSDATGGLF